MMTATGYLTSTSDRSPGRDSLSQHRRLAEECPMALTSETEPSPYGPCLPTRPCRLTSMFDVAIDIQSCLEG